MDEFSNPKVLEHFKDPIGSKPLDSYDIVGEYGSPVCGDSLKVWIKLSEDKKRVADASFKAFGCMSAVASSSALMSLLKEGPSVEEASKLTAQDVAAVLGGLPESKMHCPEIPLNAMRKALSSIGQKTEIHPIEMNVKGHMQDHPTLSPFEVLSKTVGLWIREIKPSLDKSGIESKLLYVKDGVACVKLKGDLGSIAGISPAKWIELKLQEEVFPGMRVSVQEG